VGEAFRRNRAAAFHHRRHRYYQMLVDGELLRMARATDTRCELSGRLSNQATGLAVGSHCIVRDNRGDYEIVHGNMVVGQLPAEANATLGACRLVAPSLNGAFPCRVTRIGAFGGVSLEIDVGNDNVSR
jgi:hypothetical protein